MNTELLSGEQIIAINKISRELTLLTPGHAPVYLATLTLSGLQATFYCPSCRRAHFHGPFAGHVVAHCADSKAHPHGYVLMLVQVIPCPPRRVPTGSVYPKYPATV
ncbi:MAG TPA: hypothetical protein VJ673_23565 [Aromatoleum sp.]|uniref:hypothetical protein n=1 Tax=Aromatoleum sp. TaxID=2307007 RepID=UPI002B4A03C1|nr:hypothetical protein [Aromatoleum sp.]HJV28678.1 hypothetical protein [Aromatoleum sp.]